MTVLKFVGWFVISWIGLLIVNFLATLVTGVIAGIKLDEVGVPPQGVPGIQHYGRAPVLLVTGFGYIVGISFVVGASWIAAKYASTSWLYPASLLLLAMGISRDRIGRDRDLFGASGDYFVVATSNSIGGGVFWGSILVAAWRLFT
jgi:hypothetical protein